MLPHYDQLRTLYFEGAFVIAIRYYKHKVNLYMLHDFYVEVFYDSKADKIDKVVLMDYKSSRRKFYEDQIKLPIDLLA